MIDEAAKTLFYPANASKPVLVSLINQVAIGGNRLISEADRLDDGAGDVDTLEFPEAGGDVTRELAIPFLPHMDEVRVSQAEFVLHGVGREAVISQYTVTERGGSNVGRVVALARPGQLRKVELSPPNIPGAPDTNRRVVVRSALPSNGGFSFGPPLFADPPFHLSGNLYGPVLGGMTVNRFADGRVQLVLPNVLGTAWLIQFATGDEATKLTAVAADFNVQKVTITAAPSNLSLVVAAPEGDILLWSFPNALLPAAGDQQVGFTPIAQKLLADRLKQPDTGQITLPIPLRFHADSGGAVGIRSHSLTARYVVYPVGTSPQTLALRGDRTPWTLHAPPRLRPESGTARLVVKSLGRALNEGTPLPSSLATGGRPSAGLLVTPAQWAAAAMPFVPPAWTGGAGSSVPLASVRLYVQAWDEAEVVANVCSDVGGVPGPSAAQVVRKLAAQTSGWVEFELPAPLPVVAGQAPLWVTLRCTRGRVLWFGSDAPSIPGSPRMSLDRGASWGGVDPVLSPPLAPLVQLFHAVPDAQAALQAPVVSLWHGATQLREDLLAGAVPNPANPREVVVEAATLPPALLALLATAGGVNGGGRVDTTLHLLSRSALDLTVEAMTLAYSPYQTGGG